MAYRCSLHDLSQARRTNNNERTQKEWKQLERFAVEDVHIIHAEHLEVVGKMFIVPIAAVLELDNSH